MKQSQKLLSIFVVMGLLIASLSQIIVAQDTSEGATAPQPEHVFIPFISNSEANNSQVEEDVDSSGVLTVTEGSISPLSSESTDKATIAAANAAGAGTLHPISLIVTFDSSINVEKLEAVPNGKIVHRYTHVFNGISAITPSDNIAAIAGMNGVTGVYLDKVEHPDTDASPTFIGAPTVWKALGGQKSAGEGVIVGVIDTGVWPEHPSFSDPDPSGKPYAPPPAAPSGHARACEFGSAIPGDAAFTCNNKLIGAYRFMETYDAATGTLPNEFLSARDDGGHGTHTASTSAGNGNVHASIFGVDRGIVSGIAPRAYVIAYKVCGDEGCYGSDSAAAVEQAIADGVNVINFSISGGANPYGDAVELAFLHAYANGIFVAASAGNSGPGLDTTDHRGPWVTTVAASTSNRAFVSTVNLTASNGDTLKLKGSSIMGGINTPTPVVISPDPVCGPQPAGTFTGKIVICTRGAGGLGRVAKGFNVKQAGGVGMFLRNPTVQDTETDNHFLPAVHLDAPDGDKLIAFVNAHTGVTATFTPGVKASAQGDIMAAFSSRGGPGQTLGVSKPDVTAPGVQILAGASPLHVGQAEGPNGELFQAIAGTSMSSPHVAGAGALLKALHPNWTPGQIKSALMTTATYKKVVKEDGKTPATSFEYGSGRIDLSAAGDPGITFDASKADYEALQATLWNANYPSFYHPGLPGAITVKRTAKDVLGKKTEWELKVKTDKDDWQIIVPDKIKVPANGQTDFNITVDARNVPLGQVRQGMITLTSDKSTLHFPVTFVRSQAVVTLNKSCTPANFKAKSETTTCTIAMQNTSFSSANVNMVDKLPDGLKVVPGTLVGGSQPNSKTVGFQGALDAASPPQVSVAVAPNSSPAGYLPLSAFGIAPIAGVGDESITNFNVPSFVYAGENWTRIGVVSNGYVVVGGGTSADVEFANTNLPDANPPNNILAPFWTDLNPAVRGTIRMGTLTDGINAWLVINWDQVTNYSADQPNSFEIWIGLNGTEDISFTYDQVTQGDGSLLTVGAENKFGNSGGAVYFNGTGTAPAVGSEVSVTSIPGTPGVIKTVTFQLKASDTGKWQNCAEMTSDLFQGTAISCANGKAK
ncbi:S8 family serine peptidase [soil metagenome]